MPRCSFRIQASLAAEIARAPGAVDWFEVLSDHYLGVGGTRRALLERLRASHPIALHGVSLSIAGSEPLDPEYLVRIDVPTLDVSDGVITAMSLYVAGFGNIALNMTRDDVEQLGIVSGTRLEIEHAGERYYAVMARTFADARPGDVILYEDSYKNMTVAISRGNAARMLHAAPGQEIRISLVRNTVNFFSTFDRTSATSCRFSVSGK